MPVRQEKYGSSEPDSFGHCAGPCEHGHGVGHLGGAVDSIKNPDGGKTQFLGGAEPGLEIGRCWEVTAKVGRHEDAKLGGSGHDGFLLKGRAGNYDRYIG